MSNRGRMNVDKRPPRNSKYNDVKSRINTGSSVQKLKQVTARQVNKRRDEQFFRITSTELSDLLAEYEAADLEEDIHMNKGFTDFNPRVVIHDENDTAKIDRPYLILDIRDENSFRSSHIMQSRSFPQRLLMQDKSSKELVSFKSIEGKLVVLYDDAQTNREAAAAAQILASRGFDNVFVLVGGISEFASKYRNQIDGEWQSDADIRHGRIGPASSSSSSSSSGSNSSNSSQSSYNHHNQDNRSCRSSHAPQSSIKSSHSKMSSMKSQCQSSHSEYRGSSNESSAYKNRNNNNYPNHQQLSLKSMQANRKPFDENDERGSRMSNASVADSVISRAQIRKQGGNMGRYR
eukprot:CAMPEP_0114347380 /NCGR_PEP_ID=MMETSP0101-20121206/13839_1 /TAXON_ID=38822 ORGANISM="Pteridomonas danica, Strain PT" /NCGR_SAMPLE_ID=MMETSP0101 /ASSEMBLY_ACC=CAM_ASM_000211 /LENGTH=347 /DNA_ID=CAMNT_0001484625 /DNA_START=122 /DNA_END=1165 /DNA_ORIENTATION=+